MANFNELSKAEQIKVMVVYEKEQERKLKERRYGKKIQMQIAYAKANGYNPTDAEVDAELAKNK